jgi:hypothetical protein
MPRLTEETKHCVVPYVMERVMGIEPTTSAWKAEVLPLNYTRIRYSLFYIYPQYAPTMPLPLLACSKMMGASRQLAVHSLMHRSWLRFYH